MFPINIGGAESSVFSFVGIEFSPRELLIEGRNASIANISPEDNFQFKEIYTHTHLLSK